MKEQSTKYVVLTCTSTFRQKYVVSEDELQSFKTPYFDRASLPVDQEMSGPAILLQTDSTTVVPPGWRFSVDKFDNVLMFRDDA